MGWGGARPGRPQAPKPPRLSPARARPPDRVDPGPGAPRGQGSRPAGAGGRWAVFPGKSKVALYIFVQVVFMLMRKRMELQTARRWSFSLDLAALASQAQSKGAHPGSLGLSAEPSNWEKRSCGLLTLQSGDAVCYHPPQPPLPPAVAQSGFWVRKIRFQDIQRP